MDCNFTTIKTCELKDSTFRSRILDFGDFDISDYTFSAVYKAGFDQIISEQEITAVGNILTVPLEAIEGTSNRAKAEVWMLRDGGFKDKVIVFDVVISATGCPSDASITEGVSVTFGGLKVPVVITQAVYMNVTDEQLAVIAQPALDAALIATTAAQNADTAAGFATVATQEAVNATGQAIAATAQAENAAENADEAAVEALAAKDAANQAAENALSGIKDEATPTTVPSPTGFERWIVHTAGTYTNFGGIVVTAADLDVVSGVANNRVILEVQDGVATKRVERLKGDPGAGVADIITTFEGKNKFDKTKAITGKLINETTGNEENFASAITSPWISVDDSKQYYLSGRYTQPMRFRDSNSVLMKPITEDGTPYAKWELPSGNNGIVYVPTGAVEVQFMITLWGNGTVDTVQLEEGATASSYADYEEIKVIKPEMLNYNSDVLIETSTSQAETGKSVSGYVKSKALGLVSYGNTGDSIVDTKDENYLIGATISSGGILFTGQPATSHVSGFTPVEPGKTYTPNVKGNVVFYDENFNYIDAGFDNSRPNLYFAVPQGSIRYVRLNNTDNGQQIKLVEGQFSVFPEGTSDYKRGLTTFDGKTIEINSVSKASDLINDLGFVTQSQVNASISDKVAVNYLQTNYSNKSEASAILDGRFSALSIGTSQIGNQTVTKDKLALSLWNEIASGNITITNNPDEEDLTATAGLIGLKSRSNYTYLKKGTQITQAVVNSWSDKIVEIRHDHQIMENVNFNSTITLVFAGGWFHSSAAWKVNGAGAKIIAERYWIFRNVFTSISDLFSGYTTMFTAEYSYPEWFGSGNGVMDCSAISLCATKFQAVTSLKKGKVYITHKSVSGSINGNFATLKKNPISVDINVVSAVGTTNGLTLTVDNSSPDLAKLQIGMQVDFVNKQGDARKLKNSWKLITAINGNEITMTGLSGGQTFAAGEAQMVNCFIGISLGGESETIQNLKIDGSRDAITHLRTYWELCQEMFISSAAKNTIVQNCIIENCQSEGITLGGRNTTVKNNLIINCGGNGIHLSGSYGAIIDHNQIYDTNKKLTNGHNEGAITYSNEVYCTKITNNIFDGCLTGIGSIDSGFNSDSFIAFNTFRRYKTHGIDATCTTGGGSIVDNMVIIGNRFCGKHIPKTTENNPIYIPPIENNYTEAVGDGVRLMANGVQIQSVIVSDNIFECASVNFKNAEIVFNGNTFVEKAQSFSADIPDYLVTMNNVQGSMNGNNIISIGSPNRLAVFDITTSDMAINGNFVKGNVIQKGGQSTDLTGNKIVTV